MAKLKLDLHTHCLEATGFLSPTVDIVGEIVARIRERGLDGIAVTEHNSSKYGYAVKEIVEQHFNNEVLIIPGQEIDFGRREVVELYLPNNSTFRFLAHPGRYPGLAEDVSDVQGIEIDNALHNWHINKVRVRELAEKHGLLLLRNSDAHNLEDIGTFYNEIELEELYAKAQGGP
jgi:predicted metal-dependent phosphoesterase TrpH